MSLDRFGGWAGVTSRATGFFRVEEIDGRWWFIDPDGNAFISIGVNHCSSRSLQMPWNKQIYEEKYGNDAVFFKEVEKILRDWNFNTIGAFSNYREYVGPDGMPYAFNLRPDDFAISRWQPVYGRRTKTWHFPDVFSEEWTKTVEENVKPLCIKHKNDPLLIGYHFVDIPCWEQVTLWADTIIKNRDTPGKRTYVDLMKERYSDIREWNLVHATNYKDFDDLLEDNDPHKRDVPSWAGRVDRPRIIEDDIAFLGLIASRYYHVLGETFRRYDPNHLILGDRFDGNEGVPDIVLRSMGEYVDVLSIQYYPVDHYRNYGSHNALISDYQKIAKKPVFLADSAFSVSCETMPSTMGPLVSDQYERGRKYTEYFRNIFSIPFVIGWCWCGYIDSNLKTEPLWQHSGLKNELDEPYIECVDQIRRTNKTLYEVASKANRL